MTSIESTTRYTTDWAALIRELKTAKKWTSQRLAERVGASPASVGGWLAGKSKPGPEFAAKLAALAEGRRVVTPRPTKAAKGKSTTRPAGGPTRRLAAVSGTAVSRRPAADPVQDAILNDTMLPEKARAALATVRLAVLEALG